MENDTNRPPAGPGAIWSPRPISSPDPRTGRLADTVEGAGDGGVDERPVGLGVTDGVAEADAGGWGDDVRDGAVSGAWLAVDAQAPARRPTTILVVSRDIEVGIPCPSDGV